MNKEMMYHGKHTQYLTHSKRLSLLTNHCILNASNFTALRLSAFGMGITIVPKMSIDMLTGALRLNTSSLDKNPIMWQVIVAYRKGVYLDKAENECW